MKPRSKASKDKAARDESEYKVNQGQRVSKNRHVLKKLKALAGTDATRKATNGKMSMGDILKKYQFCTLRGKQTVAPPAPAVPVRVKSELVLFDPELDALFKDSMALGENMANDIRVLELLLSRTASDAAAVTSSTDRSVAPDIVPVVNNVVSTFLLGCQVDQRRIAQLGLNVVFEPKKFCAVRMAIRNPASKALIFANGNVICTGTNSPALSKKAARRFARIVMKLGHSKARLQNFRICNMTASCDLNARIDLGRLYQCEKLKSPGHIGYDSEQFPGLSYPIAGTKLNLMIFHTGKINITGGRSQDEINKAVRDSYSSIMSYSVKNPPSVQPLHPRR